MRQVITGAEEEGTQDDWVGAPLDELAPAGSERRIGRPARGGEWPVVTGDRCGYRVAGLGRLLESGAGKTRVGPHVKHYLSDGAPDQSHFRQRRPILVISLQSCGCAACAPTKRSSRDRRSIDVKARSAPGGTRAMRARTTNRCLKPLG